MTKHKPKDRIDAKLDVSNFYQYFKICQWALSRMSDEIDKAVALKGSELDHINTKQRRSTDLKFIRESEDGTKCN